MGPRSRAVAEAMSAAALRTPAMEYGEDADERGLYEFLAEELGVEGVLLVPTCTMANQIAIRLHLPDGGRIVGAPLSHVLTSEASATRLTGVLGHAVATDAPLVSGTNHAALPPGNGHPEPEAVEAFLAERDGGEGALVWLENTHMLTAGSMIPAGWQRRMAEACKLAGTPLHLDGSRLWNAAVGRDAPMADLMDGCDTAAISLNKAIGAPLGSVLAGSRETIEAAVRVRQALCGEWRPIGVIAAAALAALQGWRERLQMDAAMTAALASGLAAELGDAAIQPAPTNLVFLNRPGGDAVRFVDSLARRNVGSIIVTAGIVRLAIHNGIREREVVQIVRAVVATNMELAAA